MSNWISSPQILSGNIVELVTLDPIYFIDLSILATDKDIWKFYPYDGSDPKRFEKILLSAMDDLASGTQFPFVIKLKSTNKIIGSTRFMDIQPNHRKLEIGSTWLVPHHWGTAVNLECKLLLLTFCFETLKTFRVQFKTDETNVRSRKAIEKIGGRFEGILRNDILRENGTHRNSAYFSIIDSEWNGVKQNLERLLDLKLNAKV